jgi:hypothetical protein
VEFVEELAGSCREEVAIKGGARIAYFEAA